MINKGDIVLHTLSGLYYRCENSKQAAWMNFSNYYKIVDISEVPKDYYRL